MKKVFLALVAIYAVFCTQHLSAQTQINQASLSSGTYNITSPGSYILTSNLTVSAQGANAIYISTSNVDLNLNGFTVIGPLACNGTSCNSSLASVGIESIGTNNEIHNGSISGFYYDIYSTSGSIHDMRLSSCVYCVFGTYLDVRHASVSGATQDGIYALYSTLSENVIGQSYGIGITALNCSVLNNTVTGMNGSGISATSSTVMSNTTNNNTGWGISMSNGYLGGNTMFNNTSGDQNLSGYAVTTKNNACSKGAC